MKQVAKPDWWGKKDCRSKTEVLHVFMSLLTSVQMHRQLERRKSSFTAYKRVITFTRPQLLQHEFDRPAMYIVHQRNGNGEAAQTAVG